MKHITNKKELMDIVDSTNAGGTVILKVGNTGCSPCMLLEHTLDDIAPEYPDHIFLSVDMTSAEDDLYDYLTEELEVRSVPTAIRFHNGFVESGWTGVKTKDEIRKILSA